MSDGISKRLMMEGVSLLKPRKEAMNAPIPQDLQQRLKTIEYAMREESHEESHNNQHGVQRLDFSGESSLYQRIAKDEAELAAKDGEIERLTKELAFRDFAQARTSDIALNYGPYDEIQKSLSSEIALHAAWTKRATEAEAQLAQAQEDRDRLQDALNVIGEKEFANSGYNLAQMVRAISMLQEAQETIQRYESALEEIQITFGSSKEMRQIAKAARQHKEGQ